MLRAAASPLRCAKRTPAVRTNIIPFRAFSVRIRSRSSATICKGDSRSFSPFSLIPPKYYGSWHHARSGISLELASGMPSPPSSTDETSKKDQLFVILLLVLLALYERGQLNSEIEAAELSLPAPPPILAPSVTVNLPAAKSRLRRAAENTAEGIALIARTISLIIRFTPLIVTLPLFIFWKRFGPQWYRLLVWTLEKSGPTFIKLGQWAATRRDLFGDNVVEILSTLHSQAPAHSFRDTERIIFEQYGRHVDEVFVDFERTPVASGAIAQVYRAKVRVNGQLVSVAVKVRHPRAEVTINRDLTILRKASYLLSKIMRVNWMQLEENVQKFHANMIAQIRLDVEAKNLIRFRENFKDAATVRFPAPVASLCTPAVLVETFEPGVHVSRFVSPEVSTQLRKNIASLGMDCYLKMMLVDSFVHADLHPGNIMVDASAKPPQIVLLDAGLVTELSEKDRQNFRALFSAVVAGNGKLAASLMAAEQNLPPAVVDAFSSEMAEVISEVEVGKIFTRILALGRKYRVRIESNFTTLVVGTLVLEGLGRQLDPEINIIDSAKKFLQNDPEVVKAFLKARLSRALFG